MRLKVDFTFQSFLLITVEDAPCSVTPLPPSNSIHRVKNQRTVFFQWIVSFSKCGVVTLSKFDLGWYFLRVIMGREIIIFLLLLHTSRECEHCFNWPSNFYRETCPIYSGTLKSYIWSRMNWDIQETSFKICYFQLWFLYKKVCSGFVATELRKNVRTKHFSSWKNDDIFHIIDRVNF